MTRNLEGYAVSSPIGRADEETARRMKLPRIGS